MKPVIEKRIEDKVHMKVKFGGDVAAFEALDEGLREDAIEAGYLALTVPKLDKAGNDARTNKLAVEAYYWVGQLRKAGNSIDQALSLSQLVAIQNMAT